MLKKEEKKSKSKNGTHLKIIRKEKDRIKKGKFQTFNLYKKKGKRKEI